MSGFKVDIEGIEKVLRDLVGIGGMDEILRLVFNVINYELF